MTELYLSNMHRGTALWMFLASLSACDRVAPAARSSDTAAPVAETPRAPAPPVRQARAPGGGATRPVDTRSLAVLKEALDSKDYATRLIAVEAMGQAKLDTFVPSLEHTLGDPEHDVRMAAVEALEACGSPRANAILATVRDDTTEALDIRVVAAGALLRTTP